MALFPMVGVRYRDHVYRSPRTVYAGFGASPEAVTISESGSVAMTVLMSMSVD